MITLYSQEAEFALLGLLLKKSNLVFKVSGFLLESDFFIADNQKVYGAILNAYEKEQTTNSIMVLEFLEQYQEKDRKDWMDYLAFLLNQAGIELNIDKYIKTIKEKSQTRLLKETLIDTADIISTKQASVQDLIEEVENKLFKVTRDRELKDFKRIDQITEEYLLKIENFKQKGSKPGIVTGIKSLDKIIGNFEKGDFIILAARPSIGKTAVSLEFARNMAEKNNVGYFSIEMPNDQLILRMLSSLSFLTADQIKNPESLDDRQKISLEIALDKLKKLNLSIDDSPSLKVNELAWKARKMKSMGLLDVMIIDYIQLINVDSSNKNKYQEISDISKALKQLSRELKIPIIALAQLSRKVEERKDPRPILSDLRDSGAIEQDADLIIFLYRDLKEFEYGKQESSEIDLKIDIAKHRNGPTGETVVHFNKKIGRLIDKGFSK